MTVGVIGSDGAMKHMVEVPCKNPAMQHDVAITKTRTVLMDGPLRFNLERSIQGGRPFDFDMRCVCTACDAVPPAELGSSYRCNTAIRFQVDPATPMRAPVQLREQPHRIPQPDGMVST